MSMKTIIGSSYIKSYTLQGLKIYLLLLSS